MRTPTEDEVQVLTQFCSRCEVSCLGIVFCDNCPSTCCIHLSGKVNNQLWCVHCIEEEGLDPDIVFRWFWMEVQS